MTPESTTSGLRRFSFAGVQKGQRQMKKRRRKITGGDLVKIVDYTPPNPHDTKQQRAAKHKTTTAAQKIINAKLAQSRLEMKLAANFSNKDYFVTFTYSGDNPDRKTVKKNKNAFIRQLRTVRRARNQAFKWIFCIECKHGNGRYHLHAVINAADRKRDFDEIRSLWPYGHVEITRLFNSKHAFCEWLDVARYMTKERPENGKDETPVGAQIYTCSRNLEKPIIETEWIEENEPFDIPAGADVLEEKNELNYIDGIPVKFAYVKYLVKPLHLTE